MRLIECQKINIGNMSEPTEISSPIQISADTRPSMSYAAWQNSVPLIKSLVIRNSGVDCYEEVTLSLVADSGCIKAKQWDLGRIEAHGEVVVDDRIVDFDPAYLSGLNESEKSRLRFSLSNLGVVLAQLDIEVRVLARNEWGGLAAGGELLASFVMPNDGAIAKLLKAAAKLLERGGHSGSLDGYQSGDPQRAFRLVASLWNAVCSARLTYANPPASFEAAGQKTRLPEMILSEGLATCLDLSLLFAAAIEAVGLNPVVVMTRGHCFVGVWMIEKTLNQIVEVDATEIRKAVAGQELVIFETTESTHVPPARFSAAIQTARRAIHKSREHEFVAAIDIQRARMAQIRPLASHSRSQHLNSQDEEYESALPLAKAPEFDQLAGSESTEKPESSNGRIDRWQRKLLDLTLRNRLLNFRSTLQTLPVLCTDIARLEDLLANGKRLKLISLPDQNPIGERDPELHRQMTDLDLNTEFAKQALGRNEVCCTLSTEAMERRLVKLFRAAKNDMAEGGTNTLFLAVGFLRWRQNSGEKKLYRAPLLLVPIKLTRQSSQSPFYLRMHEDETRFNSTLLQMLKQDFGKDLTFFESDLPRDESGINVPLILQQVRKHIRAIPGMEVADECALGRFSFVKYLLWKDLVDRTHELKNNRVVRHLLEGSEQVFLSDISSIPKPDEVEEQFHPQEIYHPLDADSTQLAAIMAASAGNDFVLIGPPGTGKSQTIANIIAQCLASEKTVLFVAEKTAALEVVHRRLLQHGLGDCVVELHSYKAERKNFLEQLKSNWINNRAVPDNDWVQINDQLKLRRDELNDYAKAINETQPNGWTAFTAFWEAVNGSGQPVLNFELKGSTQHDQLTYEKLETAAARLGEDFQAAAQAVAFPMISVTDWSVKWESELLEEASRLSSIANLTKTAVGKFTHSIGVPNVDDASFELLTQLGQLAIAIQASSRVDLHILEDDRFNEFDCAFEQLELSMASYRSALNAMGGDYGEQAETLPLEELDFQWRNACSSFWPFSWFAKRKVTRLLQTYAKSGRANPATDLNAIRGLRKSLEEIESNLLKERTQHWNGIATDLNLLREQIRVACQLRDAMSSVAQQTGTSVELEVSLAPLISGHTNTELIDRSRQFEATLSEFCSSIESFGKLAGSQSVGAGTDNVCQAMIEMTGFISEHRTQLKRWVGWCDAKTKACDLGLAALVNRLEAGALRPHEAVACFRRSYAKWFIPSLVDGSDILRTFEKHKHDRVVEEFRRIDALAREQASGRVRRAIAHGLPEPEMVTKKSELGILRHQMQLKRPSKSIREMVISMPETFRKLAPCLLMSPLSIAQYLPASQSPFDVVIFDEASQITTWDSVGAIARGKQTIIVGDPRQLPPTNFFGRNDVDEFDDEEFEEEKDLESILDEAKASGLPELNLAWHYRSRHESLITFSNRQYYGNRLITFPAADNNQKGVSLIQIEGAYYQPGKHRTNLEEARAIVEDAMSRMRSNLKLPEERRRTFGVITFNIQQQSLIQDLFDEALGKHPECEWFFSDDRIEPTVVKNLENVQGDERDVMFFSITFGPTKANPRVSLNFGALNREGGHRRLNVAVTRARQQMLVYCSFLPEQLDAARSNSRGLNDLKRFLEFAQSNGDGTAVGESVAEKRQQDLPYFQKAISRALEERGWSVACDVGCSEFRIDLGIQHPDKPGVFLAGIECDGETYFRSASARDRDKTRQIVLSGLGWTLLRVWSPDWWHDPEGSADRLDQELRKLLAG